MADRTRPAVGATYPVALVDPAAASAGTAGRIQGLVQFVIGLSAYAAVFPLVNSGLIDLGWLLGGGPETLSDYRAEAESFARPIGLVAAHLGLASLVLVVWALYRFLHHRGLTWLWSVMPGVRWRYALACLLVALPVFALAAVWAVGSHPTWQPPSQWGWYLAAIVLTSPLQALGEEVMFRGYLLQALGTVVRQPWFAIVGSAGLFAFFHGTQNPWLFASRFAFGLLAGLLVWRTGGLEAGVVAHTVNNLAAFGLALFSGDLTGVRAVSALSWQEGLRDLVVFAAFALGAWLLARAMRLPWRVAPE
ncbi:MAG: CPBP family intramembrane metalloprotease [Propionibacteriaceae bacterium]|nr:CPBP family intramembrane metalloprotease [Propionibacteriaceae bacterium]